MWVVAEGLSLSPHKTYGNNLCQPLGSSWANLYIIDLILPLQRSTNPLASGCPGVVNLGQHPNSFRSSCVNLLVKFVPQSVVMVLGTEKVINVCMKASHTAFAVIVRSGKAIGHRENLLTMTNA